MATLAEIATMLQNKIMPTIQAKLVHKPTMYDNFPILEDYDRMGTTNTARVITDINEYAVNTLADGATTTQDVKSSGFIDITATRKYASEQFTHAVDVEARPNFFEKRLSNMLESLYKDAVKKAYIAIAADPLIGSVGVDNVAITRQVIQAAKSALENSDTPDEMRQMTLTTESENDVASIADYNRAFSGNGNIEREKVPNVAGFDVISSPSATLPSGALGKKNLALWLPAIGRLHLDETPKISLERQITYSSMNYRGLKVMVWLEEVPKTLGDFILTVSSTHGVGVIRPTQVVQVLGR